MTFLVRTEDTQPLICPFRTKGFHVYKLGSSEHMGEGGKFR